MGGQITRSTFHDSIGGPFPVTSHRCHHKQKHCSQGSAGGGLPATPLLFHPHTKGSQILMDLSHKAVKRQASFCNAITFSNRPVLLYEQVRLKITTKQCCWSGALRLGFTSKDPSRIHPGSLPKYACPDLVAQSGFWAKALPEEFANEGNVISFWVDKKGRVFHRINDSAAMLFFNGVRTADPLWASWTSMASLGASSCSVSAHSLWPFGCRVRLQVLLSDTAQSHQVWGPLPHQ